MKADLQSRVRQKTGVMSGAYLPWRDGVHIRTGLIGKDLTTLQSIVAPCICALNGFAQLLREAGAGPAYTFEPSGTVPVATLEPQYP